MFRLDGTFVKEVFIARNTLQAEGTVHSFALSPDKAQQFLYVLDGSNKAVRVLNRQTLEVVSNVGGHAGHNAREFFHAHSVAADSKGNLFIGEVNNGQRYYKYAFTGMGKLITYMRTQSTQSTQRLKINYHAKRLSLRRNHQNTKDTKLLIQSKRDSTRAAKRRLQAVSGRIRATRQFNGSNSRVRGLPLLAGICRPSRVDRLRVLCVLCVQRT